MYDECYSLINNKVCYLLNEVCYLLFFTLLSKKQLFLSKSHPFFKK